MLLDYVSTADEATAELLAADASEYGEPSLFARAVANNPEVLSARMAYVAALREAGSLSDRLAELAYATVSVANDCEYCVASHTTQLVEHIGLDESDVEALVDVVGGADGDIQQDDRLADSFDQRERVVISIARATAADPKRVSATDIDRLRGVGFDDAAIVQFVALVSAAAAANTIADTLNIHPADDSAGTAASAPGVDDS